MKNLKPKTKSTKPRGFLTRHVGLFVWTVGILGGVALLLTIIFVWFNVSPWPGAMVIRQEFNQNGAKATTALQKHEPSDIAATKNIQYKADDKKALFDVFTPQMAAGNNQQLPVIVWTHGGAWLSGDKTDAAPYFKLLAQAGFTVVAPDYSLAPEKQYPTQIHELNAVHKYIIDHAGELNADADRIVLAGDSAGSQLSAQMAAIITNPSYAQEVGVVPALKPDQLKGVVLTCGIYKMKELARPGGDISKLLNWGDKTVVWAYSGTRDFDQPVIKQMSPYYYVTAAFPPAFITGGNADPLTDVQSKPLASALQGQGVSTTTLFYDKNHIPALPHEYQFNLDSNDGQQALQQIIGFAQRRTQ